MKEAKLSSISLAQLKYNHLCTVLPPQEVDSKTRIIVVNSNSVPCSKLKTMNFSGYFTNPVVEVFTVWINMIGKQVTPEIFSEWQRFSHLSKKDAHTSLTIQDSRYKSIFKEFIKFFKQSYDFEGVSGSYFYLKEKPGYSEFLVAWQLSTMQHPVSKYLLSLAKSNSGCNYIVFSPESILKLINFPFTSIANVVTSLGFPYIYDQPYIDNGWILSKPLSEHLVLFYGASGVNYKMGSPDGIAQVISNSLVEQKLSLPQSLRLGLVFTGG